MELKSGWVTLDGLPLRVDYEWYEEDEEYEAHAEILEVYHCGAEILSIMDDKKISELRCKLLNGEGKEDK